MKLLDYCTVSKKKVEFFENDKKYVATGSVDYNKIVSFEKVGYNNRPTRANVLMDKNDILFAKMKDTVKVIIGDDSNIDNIYSTGFYCVKANSKVLPKFLYYYFLSDDFNNKKNNLCSGATMKAINDDGLKQIEVDFPSIDKQKEYVSIMDLVYDGLENRKNTIIDCDILIESNLQQLFNNDYCKLSDKYEVIMGQSPDSKTYNNEKDGIPFYQGKADFGDVFVNPNIYCSKPTKIAEPNDILISVRAPVGDVNITDHQCCIGRGLAAIRSKNSDINWFLFYALKSLKSELERQSTGSTFKAIGKDVLKNLIIPSVEDDIQKDFLLVVESINNIKANCISDIKDFYKIITNTNNKLFGDFNE